MNAIATSYFVANRIREIDWEDATKDASKQIAALRGFLIDGLKLPKTVRRVIVSPAGDISYVPFAALDPTRTYVSVPSATTRRYLAPQAGLRGHKVLALGDPLYEDAPGAPGSTRSRFGPKLARLPQTRIEVEAVADVGLLGAGATEEKLVSTLGVDRRWRAVHFACHGLLDVERPRFSSLALTPGKTSDGFLRAQEIVKLPVRADLVCMSACETGKGKVYYAEGVLGLTRAFMYAGAPRVLCSLWKVDDEATRALMIEFYRLWNPKEGDGLGAAEALKRAQAHIRGNPKWKHPYYWAAWSCGDSRTDPPLHLRHRPTTRTEARAPRLSLGGGSMSKLVTGVLLVLTATTAFARGEPDAKIATAEAFAKDGKPVEAAAAYAEAMTAALKTKDVTEMEKVATSMRKEMGRSRAARDASAGIAGALLAGLDAKRNAAFLSRGLWSHHCLLDATRTGDRTNVDEACAAAIAYAKVSKAGAYAKAMGTYAQGLLHAAKQEYGKACPFLQKTVDVMCKERWAMPAVLAATEAAAAYAAAGQVELAKKVLATGGKALDASGDRAVAQMWRAAVTNTLAGADEEVLKAANSAVGKHMQRGGSAGAAGGRGGKGGRGGGGDESKVGAAWKKLSKKKPFVTVKRTSAGFEIRQSFDKRFEATQSIAHGVKHHDDGGITLSFFDGGVRLHMVDLKGLRGQPGESSEPRAFELFFPLAVGETWGVTKSGDIVIK